jgi:ABC-2 type transport system permease protein
MPQQTKTNVYGGAQARSFNAALRDLREGIAQYQYWHHSALNDVRARYHRTALGEFWIGINLGVFVIAVGFFYGALLHLDPAVYLPHLLVGYTFWLLFSTLVVEGCQAFIANGALLRQRRTPLSSIVLRNVDRAFLTLAHNLVVVAIGLVTLQIVPTWRLALLLPALALWWVNAMWMTLALGIVCARFRDVPPAILSIVQVVFLISPVLWRPEDVPASLQKVIAFNPLTHFLALVRDPLLGVDVFAITWAVTLGISVAGWASTLVLLRLYRARVVYWV